MPDRPNIVIITTHDTGQHFGCYGVPSVHTPAIDAFAADGVMFTRMFATSPICTPSRGSLLTGLYPQSNGLFGLAGSMWDWRMNDTRQHMAHRLRDRGYAAHQFGLHHESRGEETAGLGFEHSHRLIQGRNAQDRDAVSIAETFRDFARQRGAGDDRPLYAQIGFFETHTPYDFAGIQPDREKGVWFPPYVPEAERDEKLEAHIAGLQGMVRHVDRAVAIILEALRESGLEENTLVLFNVDHGPELPRAKWFLTDPGLLIGFIARWPGGGVTGGRTCDWMLSNVDFAPTLFELLDLDPPAEGFEGVSFADALRGDVTGQPSPRDEVFALFVNGQNYMARTADSKVIRNFNEGAGPDGRRCVEEFYDLAADPGEWKNVADDPALADRRRDLNDRLWRWLESVNDPILRGPVPTPTYDRAIADYRERYQTPG